MLKFDDVEWLAVDHETDAASKISGGNHSLLPSPQIGMNDGYAAIVMHFSAGGTPAKAF
jgi:hypothetical protein